MFTLASLYACPPISPSLVLFRSESNSSLCPSLFAVIGSVNLAPCGWGLDIKQDPESNSLLDSFSQSFPRFVCLSALVCLRKSSGALASQVIRPQEQRYPVLPEKWSLVIQRPHVCFGRKLTNKRLLGLTVCTISEEEGRYVSTH